MKIKGFYFSNLWRKEEWLVVKIKFLVIALVLARLTVKPPKFKWTTDREFSSFAAKTSPAVGELALLAEEKEKKRSRNRPCLLNPPLTREIEGTAETRQRNSRSL